MKRAIIKVEWTYREGEKGKRPRVGERSRDKERKGERERDTEKQGEIGRAKHRHRNRFKEMESERAKR